MWAGIGMTSSAELSCRLPVLPNPAAQDHMPRTEDMASMRCPRVGYGLLDRFFQEGSDVFRDIALSRVCEQTISGHRSLKVSARSFTSLFRHLSASMAPHSDRDASISAPIAPDGEVPLDKSKLDAAIDKPSGLTNGNSHPNYNAAVEELAARIALNTDYAYTPRKLRVITIGAGFSGLLIAHKFQHRFPELRDIVNHTIFEARNDVGGTW